MKLPTITAIYVRKNKYIMFYSIIWHQNINPFDAKVRKMVDRTPVGKIVRIRDNRAAGPAWQTPATS